jgi:hypothetical protein
MKFIAALIVALAFTAAQAADDGPTIGVRKDAAAAAAAPQSLKAQPIKDEKFGLNIPHDNVYHRKQFANGPVPDVGFSQIITFKAFGGIPNNDPAPPVRFVVVNAPANNRPAAKK